MVPSNAVTRGESANPSSKNKKDEPENTDEDSEIESFKFPLLFSAYIFANKIQAPRFKDYIFNELMLAGEAGQPPLHFDDIRFAYENTCEDNDPIRRYCVRQTCGGTRENLEKNIEDPEFLRLCAEVGEFGTSVLKRCSRKIRKREKSQGPGVEDK